MRYLYVGLVSLYLLAVGSWLLLTKQLPSPGFGRILRARLWPLYRGRLADFQNEIGHCYIAPAPERLLSDRDSESRIVVFEGERPLGPGHAAHADIRTLGAGRFSHWGPAMYFSTSDNSDPRTNGRAYTIREQR